MTSSLFESTPGGNPPSYRADPMLSILLWASVTRRSTIPPETNSNDFGWLLELFEQIRIRFSSSRKIFFERFEFLVCSKFNHTHCGRTCACAVACLYPHNSISNVEASVTIHDDTHINVFFYEMFAEKRETIVEGQGLSLTEHHGKSLTCKSFVMLGFCPCLCVSVSLSLCLCLCAFLCVVVVWRDGRRRRG